MMFNEKKLFFQHLSPTAGLFNLGQLNRPSLHRDKELIFYSNIALLPIFRDKSFFSNRRLGDIINFDKGF